MVVHLVRKLKEALGREKSHQGEKRKAHRVRVPPMVDVAFLKGMENHFGDGNVLDISLSGMHFSADLHAARGDRLTLKIHFPRTFQHRVPLKVHASVTRCHALRAKGAYNIACAFNELDASSYEVLHSFLRWAAANRE